jgi:NAD(P)-dependent dehydrogenase (short-subunit alcohol dehydrogenase family)
MKARRWLITGVSSGLGRALAGAALARGDAVCGTLRDEAAIGEFEALAPARAKALICDVRDASAVEATVRDAVSQMGGIDVVVNNAGYCLTGAFEDATDAEIHAQFDVNVFGLMHVTRASLPILRKQGAGHIINIASLSGVTGYPGMSLYTATKFAVIGFSDALAKEVAPFGIKVTAVAPSGFRTKFGGGSMRFASGESEAHRDLRETMRERLAKSNGAQPNDPVRGAHALLALADHRDPPAHFALGFDALPRIAEAMNERLKQYETHAALGAMTRFPD